MLVTHLHTFQYLRPVFLLTTSRPATCGTQPSICICNTLHRTASWLVALEEIDDMACSSLSWTHGPQQVAVPILRWGGLRVRHGSVLTMSVLHHTPYTGDLMFKNDVMTCNDLVITFSQTVSHAALCSEHTPVSCIIDCIGMLSTSVMWDQTIKVVVISDEEVKMKCYCTLLPNLQTYNMLARKFRTRCHLPTP